MADVFGPCSAGTGGTGGTSASGGLLEAGGAGGSAGAGGNCYNSVSGGLNTGVSNVSPGTLNQANLNAVSSNGGNVEIVEDSATATSAMVDLVSQSEAEEMELAGGTLNAGTNALSTAEQLAKSSTATASSQFNTLIMYVAAAITIMGGVYYLVKKKA